MTFRYYIPLLLLFTSLVHAEPHKWMSKDGSKSIVADYVSHNQFTVTVKRADGKVVTINRSDLHPDEAQYLATFPTSPQPTTTTTTATTTSTSTQKNQSEPVMEDSAVFDTLKLGDTHKEVQAKVKASKMLELTVNEIYLGRVGLNGSYRTKQSIGGLKCLLYFDWDSDSRLKELIVQTQAQPIDTYNSSLKATWLELSKLMTNLHGQPLQNVSFPAANALQNDMSLSTHLWRLSGGGSVLLGTSKSTDGYMVSMRFTSETIEPARAGQ